MKQLLGARLRLRPQTFFWRGTPRPPVIAATYSTEDGVTTTIRLSSILVRLPFDRATTIRRHSLRP